MHSRCFVRDPRRHSDRRRDGHEPLTLFSFGYWGWGNHTNELVEAIDRVEAARGFADPLFVDIRISRSVRAAGFNGNAFERLVGAKRYRWLDALGNLAIREGGSMRIQDPGAADALLDIASEHAKANGRVLFYCACEKPCACHRALVSKLVVAAATKRDVPLDVVEWPGGGPRFDVPVALPRREFDKVRKGASSVPLPASARLDEMSALPWYSTALVRPDDDDRVPTWRVATGPARYRTAGWYLPVLGVIESEPEASLRAEVDRAREEDGYGVRRSGGR